MGFSATAMCVDGCGRFADPVAIDPNRCTTCAPAPAVALAKLERLSRSYGVRVSQLHIWFARGCGIDGCGGTKFHVDHNHDCCPSTPTCGNCTRGVLCHRHNVGLEAFLDSPSVVAYLNRTPAGRRTLADAGLLDDPIAVRVNEKQMERRRNRPRQSDRRRAERRRKQAQRLGK